MSFRVKHTLDALIMGRTVGRLRDGWKRRKEKGGIAGMMRLRSIFNTLAHGDESDYEQFENRSVTFPLREFKIIRAFREGEISTFRENDKAFRLFGTGVHVKVSIPLSILFNYNKIYYIFQRSH